MTNPIISVIIPVYNVSFYLRQCLDSVWAQTFRDYELILVDDGSTDGSGDICDEYAQKDVRIRVVHKENGGLVSARKAGFEASCGDYISNIDSDDWVEPNHLEMLFEEIERTGADICQSGHFVNDDNNETKVENRPTSQNPQLMISDFMMGKVHSGLWVKLINRKLYEQPNFRFPPCDFNEDLHTSISLLMSANKYSYVPACTYHYRVNPMSMTKKLSKEIKFKHYCDCARNLQDLHERLGVDEKLIYKRINSGKRDLIKFYSNEKELLTKALGFFPKSFVVDDIRSIGDIFYYLASRWQVVWPYRIKSMFE